MEQLRSFPLIVTSVHPITGAYKTKELPAFCGHTAYLMIYHSHSKMSYQIGDERYLAHEGSVLILPPDTNVQVTPIVNGEIAVIGFLCAQAFKDEPTLLSPADSQKIREQIRHLLYLSEAKDVGYELAMLSDLYAILYTLYRYSKSGNRLALQNELIRPSVRYLQRHDLTRKWSMKEVAALSGISETYFRTLFLQQFGCTPLQYLNIRKINRAKELLTTSLSIKEIAKACGFSDANYFSRVFQKSEGMSPGEYRRRQDVNL